MSALALDYRAALGSQSASAYENNLDRFSLVGKDDSSYSITWERRRLLLSDLAMVFEECSEENWDGQDAAPLSLKAYLEARDFILALPIWVSDPEIVAEPGGGMGFQWMLGPNRIFTASLDGKNVLTYAGILGVPERTRYGSEEFDGEIPKEILEGLAEIHQ